MGSKTLRKGCILLQRIGLSGLAGSRNSDNLRRLAPPCQPGRVACYAGDRGFESRPPRRSPFGEIRRGFACLGRGSRVGSVGVIRRFGTALPTTRSIAASDEIGESIAR